MVREEEDDDDERERERELSPLQIAAKLRPAKMVGDEYRDNEGEMITPAQLFRNNFD